MAFVLLMAAIAYYIPQQAIVAHMGSDSRLRSARGSDPKGKTVAARLCRGSCPGSRERVDFDGLYAATALVWLIPDGRIKRELENAK